MKILVTGGNGQLGSEIRHLSANADHNFTFCDIEEMDLSNNASIQEYLEETKPNLIISCGAYTAVDKAEDESELAYKINTEAPKTIAQYCKVNNTRLIHISTDYVFNGNFDQPIKEGDVPNPQSVYGKTKLEGEKAIQSILDNAYIIRTSWVYSEFGNNFVKTMLRLGSEKEEINVVSDQFGTPTWARDLTRALLQVISEMEKGNDKPGVYHFSNEGVISWYDFAKEIMMMGNLECKVHPIKTEQFPTKAKRPRYSVLDKSKIKDTFHVNVPFWKDSLMMYINNN